MKMNKKAYLPLLGAALAAGAAHAATPAQSPATAPATQAQQAADTDANSAAPKPTLVAAAASDGKDRMVCRRIKATGTRMGARVCRTEEEWEFVERGASETMRAIEGESMPRGANDMAPQPNVDDWP